MSNLDVKDYQPVQGKTYSLFGDSIGTDEYYQKVKTFLYQLLETNEDKELLYKNIRKASKSEKNYKEFIKNYTESESFFQSLSVYTNSINEHLKSLKFTKKFDKTIGAKEFQYHLYMLEIELLNMINKEIFINSDYKFALMPICLHDLEKDCKAEKTDIEFQCKSCSKKCYLNRTTKILKGYNINAYIWKTVGLKSILKKLSKEYKRVGVLGIACIPELIHGMRRCYKRGIPVMGLPLDANRCMRWMGDFHDNSINLDELEKMFK